MEMSLSSKIRQMALSLDVEIDKNSLDYFLSDEPIPTDKYADFKAWCQEKGVLMNKLEFPAEFQDGLVGVRVTEDIEHNESFLFVPYEVILSVSKAQEDKAINSIILEHPECFSEDKDGPEHTGDHMILVLALMYHIAQGTQSPLLPYLRILPFDQEMSCEWSIEDMEKLQDKSLCQLLRSVYAKLEEEWQAFKAVLEYHSDVFAPKLVNQKLFNSIYCQVQTRCFSMESLCMIPMADCLNHQSRNINYDLVSVNLHKEGSKYISYYKPERFMQDCSALFSSRGIQPKLEPRFDKEIHARLQSDFSNDRLMEFVKDKSIKLWDLPMVIDPFEPDSDDEESEDEADTFQKAKEYFQSMDKQIKRKPSPEAEFTEEDFEEQI